jgi:hypothetical protein
LPVIVGVSGVVVAIGRGQADLEPLPDDLERPPGAGCRRTARAQTRPRCGRRRCHGRAPRHDRWRVADRASRYDSVLLSSGSRPAMACAFIAAIKARVCASIQGDLRYSARSSLLGSGQSEISWYCPWCNHANLTPISELATRRHPRRRGPLGFRRIRAISLRCASCGHAIWLPEALE